MFTPDGHIKVRVRELAVRLIGLMLGLFIIQLKLIEIEYIHQRIGEVATVARLR